MEHCLEGGGRLGEGGTWRLGEEGDLGEGAPGGGPGGHLGEEGVPRRGGAPGGGGGPWGWGGAWGGQCERNSQICSLCPGAALTS